MPITKSAIKKLRQEKRRTAVNKVYRGRLKMALNQAREEKSKEAVEKAYRALDRAAKKKVIHRGKASRLKSRLMKMAKKSKGEKKPVKKTAKTTKTVKKTDNKGKAAAGSKAKKS